MRRPRLRLVLGISLPLLVIVLLLAAWAIDTSSASGKVPRNTVLAGRDISTFGEDDLAATVADVAEEYATTDVQVRTDAKTYKVPASELGLMLDEDATVQAALDLDTSPVAWGSSFLDERIVPLTFVVDQDELEAGLAELGGNAKPTEPSIVATGDGFSVVSGSDGTTIATDGVADQLRKRAEQGELPLIVNATVEAQAPKVPDESAQALADQLSKGTANGLKVTTGGGTITVPAPTARAWLASQVDGDQLVATLDAEKAKADLTASLPEASEPKNAKVVLEGGAPKILPSSDGSTCCAADTPARLLAAIQGGSGAVEIALEVKKPEFTTEAAQKLGIKEPVGTTTEWKGVQQVKSFTTYHPCCAARVTNIQRIADIVNGTVIKPGEKFDMNGIVGQRTTDKGFVSAGAIANGEHVDEVGGGVSQFATTMFNAAFFAGLPINTYQAHSEHFDRYPFGREATMGWENPNLVWTNNTPYGILVETSHTDTSVTVRFWSTQYAYGQQTGQTTGKSGSCTTVQTTRTITYPDGKTGQDTFQARYRPSGQTTC
ncbi:MAG: Vancomycin B-type resistance protein VanW [Ilumatobacteraceae bacterium]|nr:Vancomycin B-type resistance protein VanW [Ilumatobacteraceae bacterium]